MDGEKFIKQELDVDIQYVGSIWNLIPLVGVNVIDDDDKGVIKRQNSPRL